MGRTCFSHPERQPAGEGLLSWPRGRCWAGEMVCRRQAAHFHEARCSGFSYPGVPQGGRWEQNRRSTKYYAQDDARLTQGLITLWSEGQALSRVFPGCRGVSGIPGPSARATPWRTGASWPIGRRARRPRSGRAWPPPGPPPGEGSLKDRHSFDLVRSRESIAPSGDGGSVETNGGCPSPTVLGHRRVRSEGFICGSV